MDAPGRLLANSVGTELAVLPRLPNALINPDASVTIRKPWITWKSQNRVNNLSSISLFGGQLLFRSN